MKAREEIFLSPIGHMLAVTQATVRAYLRRFSAYAIELIRWPLGPLLTFASWRITYSVSGRAHVDGATAAGFLLVGIFGLITWTSTLWASGYAIHWERHEGTSPALFLSPASRAAVVAGYGIGSFVWFLPSFLSVLILGVLTGARLHVADPLALALSVLALFVASLAAGFFFAGLFVLSRNGNLIANFLQTPIFLLAGFLVPLSSLPSYVRPLSDALPVTHAIIALRTTSLLGATLAQSGRQIALALALSLVFWIIGLLGLRRMEYVAKRTGQLDLY
jgi:ABC-2 type transport system permease protein